MGGGEEKLSENTHKRGGFDNVYNWCHAINDTEIQTVGCGLSVV